tara:strand:+ start:712 stop:1287 length:576 start_codon:yes stop_codon:yes gene_type:complete
MDKLISISESINRLLERLAKGAGLLFLLTIAVIVFDVLSRKIGFQMPGLGSTRLQELEWHLHTALFSFWLGVAYVKNAHVRIDILVAGLKPKTKAWVELIGCFVFAIPYCLLAIYFSLDFTITAFLDNEGSPSSNGLPWRWIPKGCIFLGLLMLLLAVIAVIARILVFLFGPERLRVASSFGTFKLSEKDT